MCSKNAAHTIRRLRHSCFGKSSRLADSEIRIAHCAGFTNPAQRKQLENEVRFAAPPDAGYNLNQPVPSSGDQLVRHEFLDMFISYVIFLTEMSFLSPTKVAISLILQTVYIKKMTEMSLF